MQQIITRTEKVRELKELLKEKKILYLSAFFYGGKTMLLNQLAQVLEGEVLRFDAAADDWNGFLQKAEMIKNGSLLIDSIQRIDDPHMADRLVAILEKLPKNVSAVLTGRAQIPDMLYSMCLSGKIKILNKDFVMFDIDEIEQLLLNYGIETVPADLTYIKETIIGWPFGVQVVAQKKIQNLEKSIRSITDAVREEAKELLIRNVVPEFSEQERILLYNLSPFSSFSEDMARIVTGRNDAPQIMNKISRKSYMLFYNFQEEYSFLPFVREALFHEMQNYYSRDYINGLYQRAALHYELEGKIPEAISFYEMLMDREKIRELLIRDTAKRPANGDYALLETGYRMLSREMIMDSPELMKGICMLESLHGRPQESEYWYQELKEYAQNLPLRDARRRSAEEALTYLDITLAHRGSKGILKLLSTVANNRGITQSDTWKAGFNLAGNSVSLLNGGKDFCRWVPHGWIIYRLAAKPVEMALGRNSSGLADIAIGECELESNLTGNYTTALDYVLRGTFSLTNDLELKCAAMGIQSRILEAQGNAEEALLQMCNLIEGIPQDAPVRLVQNLNVYKMTLQLLEGNQQEALDWMDKQAPDETREFLILDRYMLMLKIRMYIIMGQWQKTQLLTAKLRHYAESYDRPYIRIQLHLLQAVINHRCGRGDWKEELEQAVKKARRYRLVRVIADEGIAILDMLNEVVSEEDPWSRGVIHLTREQAVHYPNYLRQNAVRPVFSDREYQVYSLLIAGYRNARIASMLNITERTVKHYTAEIYQKLGVENRSEALRRAAELGDMK